MPLFVWIALVVFGCLVITEAKAFAMDKGSFCRRRPLPGKILVGYATDCNEQVLLAVRQGINVVVWSFMDIHVVKKDEDANDDDNANDEIRIELNSLDLECIQKTIRRLDTEGFNDTCHLVSFGGWNGPHLDEKLSAQEWFEAWKYHVGSIFHGIDWDLEGHDNLQSPTNIFSLGCLNKMGEISHLAKQEGYIIGIAPPQSYLDCHNPHFSRAVKLKDDGESRLWHSDFHYFGANVYAYLLAKYGDWIDFVSIQFYESYSRAGMAIHYDKVPPHQYLEDYVNYLVVQQEQSILVNFADGDPEVKLPNQRVPLPLDKLVWGFANGWALDDTGNNDKALYVQPNDIRSAYQNLALAGRTPRGFMFWVLGEEGKHGIYYASALNDILQIRPILKPAGHQDSSSATIISQKERENQESDL